MNKRPNILAELGKKVTCNELHYYEPVIAVGKPAPRGLGKRPDLQVLVSVEIHKTGVVERQNLYCA